MIFSDYLIGVVEDNIKLFVYPHIFENFKSCSNYFGYPSGTCIDSQIFFQPLINIPLYSLTKLINPVFLYNLVIILGLLLNFIFSFKFFKKIFGNYISVLISLIFVFSPYFSYQSRAHYELIQFWPVILLADALFFNKGKYKPLIIGLLMTLITGISYYLGFFTIIFLTLYLLIVFAVSKNKIELLKKNTSPVLKGSLVFFLTSMIFLYPYISANYFKPPDITEVASSSKILVRPLEDFIIFSSRPWYFLLPSVDNPIFGQFSEKALDRLSSGGNYLTQSYFKSEHSALFLGWSNILFAFFGTIFIFKKLKKEHSQVNYVAILIVTLLIIIITIPPTFVLKGITFYSPSLILFKVFPMFRVLARLGVFILFFFLIFTGFGYVYLIKILENNGVGRKTAKIFLIPILLFSLSQFIIPIKITHISKPPEVYEYIKENIKNESPLVVYPYNKTSDAVFWLKDYKQPLINPRSYEDSAANFSSEDFTRELNTEIGLEKAAEIGAKYLVYFYENDRGESLNLFDNVPTLERVGVFPETQYNEKDILNFVKVIEAGSSVDNSAILYNFN